MRLFVFLALSQRWGAKLYQKITRSSSTTTSILMAPRPNQRAFSCWCMGMTSEIKSRVTSLATSAAIFVAEGPAGGNRLMPTFDQASAELQKALDAFVAAEAKDFADHVELVGRESETM